MEEFQKLGYPICFKELEENRPSGSIKIRVETVDYFLQR
jgi:predicted nucleotide-binding protein (sugar kinase/HSP70/actin superfamily)